MGYAGISDNEWGRYDRRVDQMGETELRAALKRETRLCAAYLKRVAELGDPAYEPPLIPRASIRTGGTPNV